MGQQLRGCPCVVSSVRPRQVRRRRLRRRCGFAALRVDEATNPGPLNLELRFWAAAFSRCGNVFFPLRQLFGLQSWTFSAAGFFPASAGFFLASDGFFPAASKMHFFCCKGAFVLLQGVFSAALNFSRCEAAFFAGVFSRCANSFFPLQGVFFLLPNVYFPFRCFFPAANLCFSRAARRQGARERRVIHWAFATCKLDSARTNR